MMDLIFSIGACLVLYIMVVAAVLVTKILWDAWGDN